MTTNSFPVPVRAIVTGAAGGIGAAVVKLLARQGARIAILDADLDGASRIASQLSDNGVGVIALGCDVTDPQQVDAAVGDAVKKMGGIDILVTCAGVLRDNYLFRTTQEDWDRVIATHLTGTFNCARAVQAAMVQQGHGKMVFLSSDASQGSRGQANYSAAKAGIDGLTRTLSLELGKFGINVNAVAPGFVETEMTRRTAERIGITYEDFREKAVLNSALRRVATADDIARVIGFLCSDDATIVTGQVLLCRASP